MIETSELFGAGPRRLQGSGPDPAQIVMPIHQWFDQLDPPQPQAETRVASRGWCLFSRPREGLPFFSARLTIVITDEHGSVIEHLEAPWSRDLDDWALDRGIRCQEPQNESERFGLALQEKLRPVVLSYDERLFDAALVSHLRDKGLARAPSSGAKLARIQEPRSAGGPETTLCTLLIDHVLRGAARALTRKLAYARNEAARTLDDALACYLDERFEIPGSRRLTSDQR